MLKNIAKNKDFINNGLSQKEAEILLKKHGSNELVKAKRPSAFILLLGQFKDFIVLILIAATLVSFSLGEISNAITILIIILMNGILGFVQEFRTERSLEALKNLSAPHARVLRGGAEQIIPAKEIVVGDLVLLETGNIVPADCELKEAHNIEINEAILTGESAPVEKMSSSHKSDLHLNSIYMGTTVLCGRGKAQVTGTGMNTEMGSIAHMLENVESQETPLQKKLEKVGKQLVFISLGACILIIAAGIYHGETVYNMLLSGISLAVAAIPEGLPAIVTVSLALGVQKMMRKNALVRKLPAVETLGSTNVICADKTGTLTENKMTVRKIYCDNGIIDVLGTGHDIRGSFMIADKKFNARLNKPTNMLLTIGALCNNARISANDISGDPTEIAIMIASKKSEIFTKAFYEYERIAEMPFDSDRKRMSVVCRNDKNEHFLFVKGAPDVIIGLCSHIETSQGISVLTRVKRERIIQINEELTNEALRVLGFCYKKLDRNIHDIENVENESNLIFVGIEGMIDPPRPQAIEAVKSCYFAGIKPVMITGDHKNTALAVARELGLKAGQDDVLTGSDIDKLSDNNLEKKLSSISVFARVTPKHKLRIVRAYKKAGNIVAMTGDGVNDAPAIKEASIGISMGKCGTDVAKEASSMILMDDNFATIVAAVRDGRIIYDNIRKFIRYLLSCNLSEILIMAAAAFLALPLPLIPIQILWINLVTDGLPALALGIDPAGKNIMRRPPRKNNDNIFSGGLGGRIFAAGTLIGVSSIASFIAAMYLSGGDLKLSRTVIFATIIIAELMFSFESRAEQGSVFDEGFFKNKYLVIANAISFVLMLIVIYNPFLSGIFETEALSAAQWMIVLCFAFFEFGVNSISGMFAKKTVRA